jgi:hypothetical protein
MPHIFTMRMLNTLVMVRKFFDVCESRDGGRFVFLRTAEKKVLQSVVKMTVRADFLCHDPPLSDTAKDKTLAPIPSWSRGCLSRSVLRLSTIERKRQSTCFSSDFQVNSENRLEHLEPENRENRR